DVIDDVQQIVRIAEAASYHEPFLADRADRYATTTTVRRDVEAGTLVTAVQYLRAQKVRAQFVRDLTALFGTFDVFVTPGMPAPAAESIGGKPPFRRMFNGAGCAGAGGRVDRSTAAVPPLVDRVRVPGARPADGVFDCTGGSAARPPDR